VRVAVLSAIAGNLRKSLLEPVGSAFIGLHFEGRATQTPE
jgi:hypothetical protein